MVIQLLHLLKHVNAVRRSRCADEDFSTGIFGSQYELAEIRGQHLILALIAEGDALVWQHLP